MASEESASSLVNAWCKHKHKRLTAMAGFMPMAPDVCVSERASSAVFSKVNIGP